MSSFSPSDADARAVPTPPALSVAKLWTRHLLAFWIPLNATVFLATAPHRPAWTALLFVLPLVVAHAADVRGPRERRAPLPGTPAWPFDLLVYALAGVQLLNVALLVRLFSLHTGFTFDLVLSLVVVGAASGHSIITAHELIHRPSRWQQRLGRLMLCSVLYEHFYTEHLRGHHARVGTPEDPATARFRETFQRFYVHTVPAQFRSAWRLECRRLGDESMGLVDRRMLRHRVVHGLLVGWGTAAAIAVFAGPTAFFAFLFQAWTASRLLEVVNYFEHYGLVRTGKRVRPVDSWDTHSWYTYYALIGLSRHADHHAYASRPYQRLRVWEEAPELPSGYIGMIPLVVFQNRRFRKLADAELRGRRLGPYAESATADAA